MQILSTFTNYFKSWFMGYSQRNVEKAFNDIVANRSKTLIKLDAYDTGKIKKSKDLARYSSVREYLHQVQGPTSSKKSR